jgi:putative ABC transport system permease protein
MFSNFFRTALRALWKKKSFSLLNIMGLAVGIAASLLIFLVVHNELSFDRYHKKSDRIYRIVTEKINRSNGEVKEHITGVSVLLPDGIRNDFPGLEKVAVISTIGEAQLYVPAANNNVVDEKRFKENDGLFFMEPGAMDMFDFTWVTGNAARLQEPNTCVLTRSLADKLFGSYANAMGKTIQMWSYRIPLQVVGVYKDLPGNTDIPIRMGASFATVRKLLSRAFADPASWHSYQGQSQCFVLLPRQVTAASIQAQLPAFVKKYDMDGGRNGKDVSTRLLLQPLKDMHLSRDYYTFKNDSLHEKELWSLGLIGLFLLLVACINFINLSTAQSVSRAKEVGVRKALGGNRSQLMKQFLQETGLITLLSILVGCLLAWLTLPLLNGIVNRELSLNIFRHPSILLFLLITAMVVTLLAGFYPALVLSRFNPVIIFRNKLNVKIAGGISLRRALVVFQFVVAQLLVIGTIVVVKQMDFFRSQSMGFDTQGTVMVNLPSDSSLRVKYPLLKNTMLQIPGVRSVSLCMDAPAMGWSWKESFYFDNNPAKQHFEISRQFGDTGFLNTFGITLAAGRLPFASDTIRELLVNETTVKKLGLSSFHEMIGKTISFDGLQYFPVVGVMKDYNSRSLHEQIQPLVLASHAGTYNWIALRIDKTNMHTVLKTVQRQFTNIYPTYLYDQVFIDEGVQRYYQAEAIAARLFKIFSFLAIFISCLGLYGLVSFMAVQKTKEVGIRKVLGASVQNIVFLFSREFTLLIGIAFVIAAPAGYYLMQKWLSDFYYHTSMGWGVFVLAIVLSVVIAWLTVGYKAIKAALANPVKSLKTE